MDEANGKDVSDLRRQAEFIDRERACLDTERAGSLSPTETKRLLHELHVHEIELEIQNEELRRTQLELETSRSKYFDLYDLAPVGYCTVNDQGLIVQANLTATALFGIPRRALVMQPFTRFIAKSDQDIHFLNHTRLIRTEMPQRYELRILKSDHTQPWMRIDTVLARDDDGSGLLVNMALSDVTESKAMENAMQESEKRYRTLVEWSPEPVIVKQDGKILYVNPSAIKLFGASDARELVGRTFLSLVQPEYHQIILEREEDILLTNRGTQMVHETLIKVDGTQIDVESQSTLIVYDGKPAIHSSLRDVTERMRLNTALVEKNAELERSKALAERANNAKSDFISGMSHDLRTPLNAILGFAQLIDAGAQPLTPSQKRSIDQILKAGWYLLDLINDILDLSLIESGKLSLSLSPIPLLDVIQECEGMVEPQANKHGIRLSVVSPDFSYTVEADSMRLRQVLNNLLSNAIKYNKQGGTVTVDIAQGPPSFVRINVRDTGTGLTADQIPQLFQPFHRLGKSASVEQGTGIGLVVCKRLVESMGGAIGVESAIGIGSVFWFELKLANPSATANSVPENPSITQTMRENDGALRALLYIAAKPCELLSMCGLIAYRSDIRLLSARDGESGIDIARMYLPDAILTDVELPGISGFDVQRILAEDPKTAHIPIIAIGDSAKPGDAATILKRGFRKYLANPIIVTEFMKALDSVFYAKEGGNLSLFEEENL